MFPTLMSRRYTKAELIIEVMEWVDMAGLIIEPIIFIRYNHARFKSLPSMTYYVKAEIHELI